MFIRDDLKLKIRACGGSMKEAAAYCGVSYTRLNTMLNGFCELKPNVERDILNYVDSKKKRQLETA